MKDTGEGPDCALWVFASLLPRGHGGGSIAVVCSWSEGGAVMLTQVRSANRIPGRIDRWLLEMEPLTRWLGIGLLMALTGLLVSWVCATF